MCEWHSVPWEQCAIHAFQTKRPAFAGGSSELRLCFLEHRLNHDEQRAEGQRDDRHEVDEDVHRRTGGILERVADGVADNGSLVSLGALATMVAALDVLLSIIPSATGVRHEDGEQHARRNGAGEETAEHGRVEATDSNRNDHGEQAGKQHLLQSRLGGDGNALVVLGLGLVLHDARNLAELTTDLFDHRVGSLGNGTHGQSSEHERNHGADEDAGDDQGVGSVKLNVGSA